MHTYTPPVVTIDGLLFRFINDELCVFLAKRPHPPFQGQWGIPGGYVSSDETSAKALYRVLADKTFLKANTFGYTEQLYTFDTPAVRGGNAISVVYMLLSWSDAPPHQIDEQAFFPVRRLPELAYEHARIIHFALERLRSKVTYTNALFALLPPQFTLAHLQQAYESILDKKLDKRNFRKKFLQLELIEPTNQFHRDGAHRPAQLYRFIRQELQVLSRNFE